MPAARLVPCSSPIRAGCLSQSPPAFPNEKRRIINFFWPRPTCLAAAHLPRVTAGAFLAPLSGFSPPQARTWWLGREQMGSPSCRHQEQEARCWALRRSTAPKTPTCSRERLGAGCWSVGRWLLLAKVLYQVALKVKVRCSFQMVSI